MKISFRRAFSRKRLVHLVRRENPLAFGRLRILPMGVQLGVNGVGSIHANAGSLMILMREPL